MYYIIFTMAQTRLLGRSGASVVCNLVQSKANNSLIFFISSCIPFFNTQQFPIDADSL